MGCNICVHEMLVRLMSFRSNVWACSNQYCKYNNGYYKFCNTPISKDLIKELGDYKMGVPVIIFTIYI